MIIMMHVFNILRSKYKNVRLRNDTIGHENGPT